MTSSDLMRTAGGVPFLRTPDANFEDLDGYPFAPNYVDFEGLRRHYVDAGPRDGPVAILMHGMPTWSFLNRHIIHGLTAAGWRCIAHDHIGFGRSDKVTDPAWYSIGRHARACRTLIETLDLAGITLFAQDWGGPTGLAQAADLGERFDRLVIMGITVNNGDSLSIGLIRSDTERLPLLCEALVAAWLNVSSGTD